MDKVLVKRVDGGVTVIIPSNDCTPELLDRDVLATPGYASHRTILDTDIPSSREFRNAWCDTQPGTQIDIDCTQALDCALKEVRAKRDPALAATDGPYMHLKDIGQDVTALKNKRDALRAITDPLKAINTTGLVNDQNTLDSIRTARDNALGAI